jgi:hypothetical protein
VETHVFFISALVGGEWSASRLGRFNLWKERVVLSGRMAWWAALNDVEIGFSYHTGTRTPSLRRMPSSGMLRRVALVRTDVSEKRSASTIRLTRIGKLGTLA